MKGSKDSSPINNNGFGLFLITLKWSQRHSDRPSLGSERWPQQCSFISHQSLFGETHATQKTRIDGNSHKTMRLAIKHSPSVTPVGRDGHWYRLGSWRVTSTGRPLTEHRESTGEGRWAHPWHERVGPQQENYSNTEFVFIANIFHSIQTIE